MSTVPLVWSVVLLGLLASLSRTAASTMLDSTSDPTVTAQMYRDEAALYPMVGKVTGSGFSGSGVLISDRWVLTAGHVSLSKINATFAVGGNSYIIQSVITHPSFSFTGPTSDLGLLYLTTPVTGVAAAALLHSEAPGSILGREATWVGHGLSGTGLTGGQAPFEFRAFTNVIDVLGPEYGLAATSFVADFDAPDGSTNAPSSSAAATRLEGNVTSGDSGGGVFVSVDGRAYLAGIHSYQGGFAPGTNAKYGSLSGATNLAMFEGWIFENTGIAAIPEPGPGWLFCGLASLLGWRRRRGFSPALRF